jgi:serine/threonine protein kinase
MELVEGETLEKLIKRSGRLEVKLALEITTQVAAGLAAVHKQKLVHRDIKPTNIMVKVMDGACRTAKIIDLGLAKTLGESASEAGISSPGAFVGTPEFASPEQFGGCWLGHPVRSVLARRNALGDGDWPNTIPRYSRRGDVSALAGPLPLEQLKDVPQPVVVLLEKLLKKDPAQRFRTSC